MLLQKIKHAQIQEERYVLRQRQRRCYWDLPHPAANVFSRSCIRRTVSQCLSISPQPHALIPQAPAVPALLGNLSAEFILKEESTSAPWQLSVRRGRKIMQITL